MGAIARRYRRNQQQQRLDKGSILEEWAADYSWIYAFVASANYLYSDNPASTPIEDSEAVRSWVDLTGSITLAQTGAEANCPTFYQSVAAMNDLPAVFADGGDVMDATVSPLVANLNAYIRFLVFLATPEDTAYRTLVSEGNNSDIKPFVNMWYSDAATPQVRSTHRDDALAQNQMTGTGDLTVTPHVVLEVRNAADDFALRVDGSEVATGSTAVTTTTTNRLTLFGNYSGGSPAASGQGYMAFHAAQNGVANLAEKEAFLLWLLGIS